MPMINIKNNGNPTQIGSVICYKGVVTPVDAKDLKAYGETKAGAYSLDNNIEIIDKDFEKKMATEKELIEVKAIQKAKEKVRPLIEAEIRKELDRKFEKTVNAFEKKIESLNADIVRLTENLEAAALSRTPDDEDLETDKDSETDAFVFDPERHSIEAKGGKWFVMEGTKKIGKRLSLEDKARYEALLK